MTSADPTSPVHAPQPSAARAAFDADAPVQVVYIIGSGRSGSTLLGRLLGGHSQALYVGEIYNYGNFFASASERPRTCSCGEALQDCPFWHQVRAELGSAETDGPLDLKVREQERFEANNFRLFKALRKVAGRSFLIDASKRFYRVQRMLASDKFEVTLVHLVRDPRAYGYSHLSTRDLKDAPPWVYYSRQFIWLRNNLAFWLRYRRRPEYLHVRYEDLTRDPEGTLGRILARLGFEMEAQQLDMSRPEFHDFSGNKRTRSKRAIKPDTRYLRGLKSWQWWLATLIVVPGLLLFGYPLARPRVAEEPS